MEIALLLLATMALGVYVLWPALRSATASDLAWEVSEDDTPTGRLATRREVLMGNIADLDFEFAMGKLAEEDYRSIRESLKRQTLRIMEQLEVIESGDERVSRKSSGGPTDAQGPASCASCGTGLPGQAAFCPSCGTAVKS